MKDNRLQRRLNNREVAYGIVTGWAVDRICEFQVWVQRRDGSRRGWGSGPGVGVRHGGRERFGALLRRRRVHPHDLPAVAVEVEEAARIHEAVVLRVIGLGGTREPLLTYRLAPADARGLLTGIALVSEIFFAAGADLGTRLFEAHVARTADYHSYPWWREYIRYAHFDKSGGATAIRARVQRREDRTADRRPGVADAR